MARGGAICASPWERRSFSLESQDDVSRSVHRAAWETIFTGENTVLADARSGWEALEGNDLAAVLAPYFRPFEMRKRFTAHQIDVLRWVLFPESRLDAILGRGRANAAEVIEVLDA